MGKRTAFTLVIIAGFIVLIEVLSAVSLAVLGLPLKSSNNLDYEAVRNSAPKPNGGEVVHPYIGFVTDDPENLESPDASPFYGFSNPRGSEVQKRSEDKLVIAITGGSVASQFAGNGRKALEKELRAYPPFADKEFVFISLAIPGFKQPQQLMTLAYFLTLGAEYDMVINIDGFNEISLPQYENLPRGIAAIYPRSWDRRLNFEAIALTRGEISYINQKRSEWRARYLSTPLSYSRTVRLAWSLLDRNLSEKAERRRREPFVKAADVMTGSYVVTGPFADSTPQDLADIWARSSREMSVLAKSNGMKYFHFLQPNQYVAGSKPMSDAEKKTATMRPDGYGRWIPAGYPYLQKEGATLASEGIRFHDLTMVFASVTQPLYVDNCCHLSEEGDIILAKNIAKLIIEDLSRNKKTDQSS